MKKKLEAELISIAHRILKLKNKSELLQLHQESQKLYEKLSVLVFVEENFAGLQPTIGRSEAYEVLETAFDGESQKEISQETIVETEDVVSKEEVSQQVKEEEAIEESESENEEIAEVESEEEAKSDEETEEEKIVVGQIEASEEDLEEEETTVFENPEEVSIEEEEEAVDEEVSHEATEETVVATETEEAQSNFELAFDKKEDVEEVAKESGHQIIFEDFLGSDYKDLEFVKAEIEKKHEHDSESQEEVSQEEEAEVAKMEEPVQEEKPKEEEKSRENLETSEPKPVVEKVTKGITIGLNDRVGFVNHLFGGSNEDFNRVLSQLNTFDTFQDAKNFIEDLVKPDYNEWKGKEDFEERFLEVVENKFK